jgi:Flp pilus assembly protein TadD
MGSTGRTGLVRMLVGSVTRHMLRQLPCSLLTVKDEDAVEALFEEDLRQVNLLMAEGRELLKNGCYLPALVKLRQVTAIDPFHVEALQAQADAHEKLGQHDEAKTCSRRAQHVLHHEEVPA